MAISAKDKGEILRRARLIGVPSSISVPFVHLVLRWADCSGAEWAVDRVKQIKLDLVRKRAGLPPASQWIRKGRNSKMFFGGTLGALERYSAQSNYKFERCLALLNLYTAFVAPHVSEKQARKFLYGVTASAVTIPPSVTEVVAEGFQLSGLRPHRGMLPKAKSLLSYLPSSSKRAPLPYGTVPEKEGVIDSLRFLSSEGGLRLLHDFWHLFSPVVEGLEPEMERVQASYHLGGVGSSREPSIDAPLYVGQIGLIQEPGFKLRAVANPGRVFQAVLQPLGRRLFDSLKHLPWDCTYQQDKADAAIVQALAQRKVVYSVDLSGATDYFPLDLQIQVLKHLLPDATDVDLFFRVSKGMWRLPKALPHNVLHELGLSRAVSWTKGQPLGLYPSFASFALTHGILLQGLLGREWDGDFYILGDDVVILDPDLYVSYRSTLDLLSCPVAEAKTLSSDLVAEFRSRVYTSDRVIPQYKWRKVSDDSFLDIVKNMPSLVPVLQRQQRAVVKAISGLPECLGGLGWNPKGLSLDERITPFLPMLLGDYVARDRVTGYSGYIRSLLYSSGLSLEASWPRSPERKDMVTVLDQRASSLVSTALGDSFTPMFELLGRNLDKVLEGNLDLPIPEVQVGRVTTLAHWKSVLSSLGISFQADP